MFDYKRKSIRSRVRYYRKWRNRCKMFSRLFFGVGVLGFLMIILGYTMYSDSVLGLTSTPIDMCFMIFSMGVIVSVIGTGLSISTGNDADEFQMRLNHIIGRIRH